MFNTKKVKKVKKVKGVKKVNKTIKGGSHGSSGSFGKGKGKGKGKGGLWIPDPYTEALQHAEAMRQEAERAYHAAHTTGALGGYDPAPAQYATFMAQVAYDAQAQADAIGAHLAMQQMSPMAQMPPRGMGLGMSPMAQMTMSPMTPMAQMPMAMSPMAQMAMTPMASAAMAMAPPSLKRTTSYSIELHDELLHDAECRRIFERLLLTTNGNSGGRMLRLAKDEKHPKFYQSRGESGLFYNWSEHGVPLCHLTLHNQKGHGDPTHDSRTIVGSFHVKMNGSKKSRRIIINFNRNGDGLYEITLCETVQQQFGLTSPIQPEPDAVLDALSEKIVQALTQYYKDTGRQVKRSFYCSR